MYTKFKGKQITVKSRTPAKSTLDATHNSRVKYFSDLKRNLPNLKKELQAKQKRVVDLEKTLDMNLNLGQIQEKNQLRSQIQQLEDRIREIEDNKEELDYYLKAGQILFEYYSNGINSVASSDPNECEKVDDQKQDDQKQDDQNQPDDEDEEDEDEDEDEGDDEDGNQDNTSVVTPKPEPMAKKSIMDIFKSKSQPKQTKECELDKSIDSLLNQSSTSINTSVNELRGVARTSPNKVEKPSSPVKKVSAWDNFVTKKEKFQRADLYEEFLSVIDPHFVKVTDIQNEYFCSKCQEHPLFNQTEACMVCPKCGNYQPLIIDSDKPNYKDVPIEISYFAYKRMNHFNECLSQFQAKESTEIPQIVYDTILMEMKKERNTNLASLTKEKVKKYLKKHSNKKFNKYYEHIPHIINRLNGLPPKTMTPRMEEELRIMFRQIQSPFEKHCPNDRKNFLNYNYVLHKFCQLKGWDDFLTCFPLLKSKEKLYQQDTIWRKICEDLQWMYIASR